MAFVIIILGICDVAFADDDVSRSFLKTGGLIGAICGWNLTHTFGATLVGITKLNPDWVFQGRFRGVGQVDYDVPKHWEYAIVFAPPHEWDMFYANAVYGSSFDADSRERIIGGRLENFIQQLGYPARAHVPPGHYDLITPPIAIDAGPGEQGGMGLLITPE
jgi:hypothetical protein